jgi:hypothetical protein
LNSSKEAPASTLNETAKTKVKVSGKHLSDPEKNGSPKSDIPTDVEPAPKMESAKIAPLKEKPSADGKASRQNEKAPSPEKEPVTEPNKPMNLMQELEQAIHKGEFQVDQKEVKEEVPLNDESVLKAWQQFILKKAVELPSNFLSNAKELEPELREGKLIALVTRSSVSRGFIMEQSSRIKSWFRKYFQQKDIQFTVDLDVDEDEDVPKQYLNPKEQFKEMTRENPALLDFQKRFDLDIEY